MVKKQTVHRLLGVHFRLNLHTTKIHSKPILLKCVPPVHWNQPSSIFISLEYFPVLTRFSFLVCLPSSSFGIIMRLHQSLTISLWAWGCQAGAFLQCGMSWQFESTFKQKISPSLLLCWQSCLPPISQLVYGREPHCPPHIHRGGDDCTLSTQQLLKCTHTYMHKKTTD